MFPKENEYVKRELQFLNVATVRSITLSLNIVNMVAEIRILFLCHMNEIVHTAKSTCFIHFCTVILLILECIIEMGFFAAKKETMNVSFFTFTKRSYKRFYN